jgi:hypothetical protein
MPILYRHIRLDTNKPFYIGIGRNIKRAYAVSGRNAEWKSVRDITPIEVEIIFEHDDWNVLCEKEKEFIQIYGRENLGTGTLVNKTSGGSSGNLNIIITEERRQSLKNAANKRFENIEERRKISNSLKGRFGGDKNPFYGKTHTEENKKKFSRKGSKHSTKTRKLMSEIRKGVQNHFYGKTHNSESLEKMKNYHSNRPTETLKKMSESQKKLRWVKNGNECKRIHMDELNSYISNGWERGKIQLNTKCNGEN